jgi:endonuclease V-like protein UPF0215 family
MSEKGKNRDSKLFRIILWVFSSILLLSLAILMYLFFSAERIINENLSDFVYQKSDSIYRLEFGEISFELKTRTVTISNIVLKPDTSLGISSSSKYYYLETNSLIINEINIRELIRGKKFHAQSLKVNNPAFRLSTGQDVDLNTFNAQKINRGDSLILPFVSEILIDTILVTDAKMKIDTLANRHRKTPNVNLELLQFKIGGTKLTDSPFPFDVADISLKIENLQENLSDQVHTMTVDEISLSLLHSMIRAKNFSLRPYADSLITKENQYRIDVPEIVINSPHVGNFYLSDTIPIDALTFVSPKIEIKYGNKVSVGTPINEINLYKLIEKNLAWINIGQFSIRNAELKLFPPNSDKVAQQFENLNIDFSQFRIDPTSYRNSERILSALELSISIDRFTLNHSDRVHRLIINNLQAETKSGKITTGPISFSPVNPSNKLIKTVNTLVDIECNGAIFNGVQFNKMYHNQIIPMDELVILSPEANISFEKVNQKKKAEKDISLILQKTRDYVKGIYVKKASITRGSLNYNYILGEDKNGFFRTKFQFELKGLSIDSTTFYHSNKMFFANNFNVRFTNIGLQLADNFHRLQTDSIAISSEGKNAEIFNFRILPIKTIPAGDSLFALGHPEIFDIHFPNIRLSGVDLHKAFFQKELSITNFTVFNPSLNIDLLGKIKVDDSKITNYKTDFYSLISNYLYKINITSLKMDNGRINLTQHRKGQSSIELSNAFSVTMYNFEIDSLSSSNESKLFFSDNIDLVLKKYSFTLADGVHKVDADEIGILSTEKRIYITNASMYPDIVAENFSNLPVTVFANVPSVEFTGTNISELFNKGHFPVNSIVFTNPEIKLMFQTISKQEKDTTQKPQFIIKGLKSFTSDQITIKNGTLELSNYVNLKSKTFATTNVDLTMKNFKVETDQKQIQTNYGDFTFSLKNTQINFPDKIHNLSIGKSNYRSADGVLKITDFKIKPLKDEALNAEHERYTILLPEVTFSGFNILKYLEEKKIVSKLIAIENPTIEIKNKKSEKKNSFNPYKLNLYAQFKNFAELIDIDQLTINKANFYLDNSKPIHFSQVNLIGKSFRVDKNSDLAGKLLSFNNIFIELNNLNGKTKDGFYNYGIEKITLNESGRFSLTGMSLIPVYSESEFNRKKIYQADYITINKADCLGQGFNIKRLIEKNEIAVGKTNLALDKVEIFRNNHFPPLPNLKIEMPQKELRKLKPKFIADSIFIHCNRFNYRELEPQATSETKLFFTDLNFALSNVTNIEQHLSIDPFTHLNIKGKIMGKGEMNAKLDLNIKSEVNEYRLEAEVGPMALQLMNPVTEPSMKLSIKEGANNKLTTYFEANEDSAVGTMKFSYSDLKISVLSDRDGMVNEDKFISFLANTFAVKSDNPRPGKTITPVSVKARHSDQRSFINYCWSSVFSGLKNTFGMKEKEE